MTHAVAGAGDGETDLDEVLLMVPRGLGAPLLAALGFISPIAIPLASAQQSAPDLSGPTVLPGIVVQTNDPPPPISRPSARDPGPAAQARKPARQAQATSQAASNTAPSPAVGSSPVEAETPTVVTPNRTGEDVAKVASAVTVIGPTEIERARGGGSSVADVLRGSPGVNVRRSGGEGAGTDVSIRGADSDQTLVMIDGVPLNDPASAQSEFDFSVLTLANVARIEVLRGPQSGVYGGDAIGGVINIVTGQGSGKPSGFAEVEGGSYGTHSERFGSSGSVGRFSYSLGVSNYYSSGFSRRTDDMEADATRKQSVAGTVGVAVTDDLSLSARFGYYKLGAEIDQTLSSRSDTGNSFDRELIDGALTATLRSFGGLVTTRATLFASQTDRTDRSCSANPCGPKAISDFTGDRTGIELQSTVVVREDDRLIVGGRFQDVTGASTDTVAGGAPSRRFDVAETHRAAFAAYAFNPVEAFTLNLSGRFDDFGDGDFQGTYRIASSYRFVATGTKLRASYGTGVKAPTIYQRFHTDFGTPELETETSRGFDFGVDQSLLGGALEVSATYFDNDIENLIVFTGDFLTGSYENVASVQSKGVELAAEWRLLEWMRLRGAYTYVDAIDADTGLRLRRKPEHEGKVTVAVEPFAGAYVAATVVIQGSHYDSAGERNKVDGFARLDLDAEWTVVDSTTVFLRAENVTDVDYQLVRGYETPGASAYAGLRVRF